jgi:hypothetical protein
MEAGGRDVFHQGKSLFLLNPQFPPEVPHRTSSKNGGAEAPKLIVDVMS